MNNVINGRRGQKHGLNLAQALAAMQATPDATLLAADGLVMLRHPGRYSEQIQGRAFESMRNHGQIEFVQHANPAFKTGGIWRLAVKAEVTK